MNMYERRRLYGTNPKTGGIYTQQEWREHQESLKTPAQKKAETRELVGALETLAALNGVVTDGKVQANPFVQLRQKAKRLHKPEAEIMGLYVCGRYADGAEELREVDAENYQVDRHDAAMWIYDNGDIVINRNMALLMVNQGYPQTWPLWGKLGRMQLFNFAETHIHEDVKKCAEYPSRSDRERTVKERRKSFYNFAISWLS